MAPGCVDMTSGQGYWREEDGSAVSRDDAEAAWGDAAHARLAQLARSYHATIEYGQIAEEIQADTGIRTSVPMRHWIGGVLGRVADLGLARDEPPLTALVVQRGTGMVGDGYDYVLSIAGLHPIHDAVERETHAASARLRCYRWAGVPEPTTGWKAAFAPALQKSLDWKAAQKSPEAVPVMCPNCFIALPLSGQCDSCGHDARRQENP